MIVWLASFPRSGNTLTRTILKQVFGVDSYSIYDDPYDLSVDQRVADAVGHVRHGKRWEEARPRLRDDERLHFVKTHEPPEDDGKAIYVVREPVSCFISFRDYFQAYFKMEYRPEAYAAGLTPWGSWSSHLDCWDPERRANTLLLRYEDLLSDAEPQIAKIAEFTGLETLGQWVNNFDHLRKAEPKFFRRGRATPDEAELSTEDALLIQFWSQRWLDRLGYDVPPEVSAPETAVWALRRAATYAGRRIHALQHGEYKLSTRCSGLEDRLAAAETQQASLRSLQDEVTSWRSEFASWQAQVTAWRFELTAWRSEVTSQQAEAWGREAELRRRVQELECRFDSLAEAAEAMSNRLSELSGIKASFGHLMGNIGRRVGKRRDAA